MSGITVQSVPEVWAHASKDGTYVVNVVLRIPAADSWDALMALGRILQEHGHVECRMPGESTGR